MDHHSVSQRIKYVRNHQDELELPVIHHSSLSDILSENEEKIRNSLPEALDNISTLLHRIIGSLQCFDLTSFV
uniref:Uncharacterized protein n=1 Tax=Heterorhabditis bacteriophora TaxID=37862 RepID=A0A1I7WJ37_HETBA